MAVSLPSPLSLFHPLVAAWFCERVGEPTDVQRRAWPEIAAGRHVLAVAPTGSGKTLTAFLWALDRLLGLGPDEAGSPWEPGRVRVLYVSPLKALNADIERNLERPLAELSERFRRAGVAAPALSTAVRSGDTPQEERQRLVRHPPEILITTPESLNILLTSRRGRSILDGLATVILDEIHAVAGSKRGTHLMTAVERLTLLSGEFQRIALSATVKPLETVADFVGGRELLPGEGPPRYRKRPVVLVRSEAEKRYDIRVRCPSAAAPPAPAAALDAGTSRDAASSLWEQLVPELRASIRGNRSTLLFTNSRRLAEKVTRFLNEGLPADLAYSHHGSLSREVRAVVEGRLKRGELPALVATSSLELGIDIGDLDEVMLVGTPKTVASAVQRVGRAGHRVGEVSRGALVPLFGRDFLDAAVVARAIALQDIESIAPIDAPLDVLAQVVLSMTAAEPWRLEDLHAFLAASHPYRNLTRRSFDLVVEMLAGRYADARVRELKPRVVVDRVAGTIEARPESDRLIYLSGGTIPDRGYFHLRLADSMARLGELDEEFVWERSIGDTFTLGAQAWRITAITHNDVLVTPSRGPAGLAPFWRADERDRGVHLSERVAGFLELAEARLADPHFPASLETDYRMEPAAAAELLRLLTLQRSATGAPLPHRHHLLVERVGEPGREPGRRQLILHTFWGGKVNRPFSLALAAAWEERYPTAPLDLVQDDDCVALTLPAEVEVAELLELVPPESLERLLRRRLASTGFFGARFRENAARALLLPRAGFRQRTPLWLSRQRSKKLLEAVSGYGDFPVVVETWRTCLVDEFDLPAARRLLSEVAAGEITVTEVRTASPSLFAAHLVWKQTNTLMYEDDTPLSRGGPGIRPDLLRELVLSSNLRPRISSGVVDEFERKVQRRWPGYAPRGARDLLEWVKERLALPEPEWRDLLEAVERDREPEGEDDVLAALASRAVRASFSGAEGPVIVAIETLPRLLRALAVDPPSVSLASLDAAGGEPTAEALAALEQVLGAAVPAPGLAGAGEADPDAAALETLLAEWSRFYGPFAPDLPRRVFGLPESRLAEALATLVEDQRWVVDRLRLGSDDLEVCDVENLETLLRWSRAAARPRFEALPLAKLPLFLAAHQGLTSPGDGIEDLKRRLEQLLGFPAPAGLWEAEILPARLEPYYTAWLDSLFQETDLQWVGVGPERLTFAFPGDLELLRPAAAGEAEPEEEEDEGGAPAGPAAADSPPAGGPVAARDLFPDPGGRYDLADLARRAGLPTAEVGRRLWALAWEGRATNDGFAAVRRGVLARFRPEALAEVSRSGPAGRSRRRFDRWQASRPFSGAWYLLPEAPAPADALEREELAKDRARLALARYGIVFRELAARELPAFQWSAVFRSLRILELSGEVLSGHFFQGIPGPQFISPAAFRMLGEGLPEDAVYWLNALDPASPCGLDLPDLKGRFPRRHPGTHLAFQGSRLAVASQRSGKDLAIHVAPDHPRLPEYLGFLKVLLTRPFNPVKSVEVETIGGEPAGASPYVEVLREAFGTTRDPRAVRLWRRY